MEIAGKFTVRVGGRPLSYKAAKDVETAIDERVRFIDENVKRETRTFPPYQVLFVWTGVPKKLEEAQILLKYLQSSLLQYFFDQAQRLLKYLQSSLLGFFTAWAFSIEIDLEEKKGP